MKTKIFDLTDYSLHPAEGLQYFSKKEAKDRLKYLGKSKKEFCVVKEKKPEWYGKDKWKQVFSIQKKDKIKMFGRRCLK